MKKILSTTVNITVVNYSQKALNSAIRAMKASVGITDINMGLPICHLYLITYLLTYLLIYLSLTM